MYVCISPTWGLNSDIIACAWRSNAIINPRWERSDSFAHDQKTFAISWALNSDTTTHARAHIWSNKAPGGLFSSVAQAQSVLERFWDVNLSMMWLAWRQSWSNTCWDGLAPIVAHAQRMLAMFWGLKSSIMVHIRAHSLSKNVRFGLYFGPSVAQDHRMLAISCMCVCVCVCIYIYIYIYIHTYIHTYIRTYENILI
jgi:hypothetical protein